jgi:hypothetical protein
VDLFGGNQSAKPAHENAKAPLVDCFQPTQAAQKGLLGVHIKGHFIYENNELLLGLNIDNQTDGPLSDFDIQINKNPFAIFCSGMANRIALPA